MSSPHWIPKIWISWAKIVLKWDILELACPVSFFGFEVFCSSSLFSLLCPPHLSLNYFWQWRFPVSHFRWLMLKNRRLDVFFEWSEIIFTFSIRKVENVQYNLLEISREEEGTGSKKSPENRVCQNSSTSRLKRRRFSVKTQVWKFHQYETRYFSRQNEWG